MPFVLKRALKIEQSYSIQEILKKKIAVSWVHLQTFNSHIHKQPHTCRLYKYLLRAGIEPATRNLAANRSTL